MVGGAVMTLIAPTLQAFFTDRLIQQRQASPQTIAAYRDTLRLLLTFVHHGTGKMPAQLDWDNLDAITISAFPRAPTAPWPDRAGQLCRRAGHLRAQRIRPCPRRPAARWRARGTPFPATGRRSCGRWR